MSDAKKVCKTTGCRGGRRRRRLGRTNSSSFRKKKKSSRAYLTFSRKELLFVPPSHAFLPKNGVVEEWTLVSAARTEDSSIVNVHAPQDIVMDGNHHREESWNRPRNDSGLSHHIRRSWVVDCVSSIGSIGVRNGSFIVSFKGIDHGRVSSGAVTQQITRQHPSPRVFFLRCRSFFKCSVAATGG